jgi:hypothetical protein
MSRRFAAILLGLAVVMALTAVPALAHTVNYTTRETGTAECDFDENVRTDIVAVGHHRHTRVGYMHVVYHTPTDQYYATGELWPTFAMNWATANQAGYPYDFLSSGGGCTV